MKFYKQVIFNTCNLIALQTVLSYYSKEYTFKELRKKLPKHSYGNLITELGIFLENEGIKTKLISIKAKVREKNYLFYNTLVEYKKIGRYEDRAFTFDDLKETPIIVNVDRNKIIKEEDKCIGHYVVILKKNNKILLYDGRNFNDVKGITFDDIIRDSKCTNRWKDNGMFLIC